MPTLYLSDADVVIRAFEDFYPLGRIPQFGSWLVEQGNLGTIKIPQVIFDEITPKIAEIRSWVENPEVQDALILQEEQKQEDKDKVLKVGYGLEQPIPSGEKRIGKDYLLIAHALADRANRVVVTREVSKSSRRGRNRKIPDVCDDLGVECIDDFELYRRLDFNTRPKK